MWVSPIAIKSLAQPHRVKWEGGCFSNLIRTGFANYFWYFVVFTIPINSAISYHCKLNMYLLYVYIYIIWWQYKYVHDLFLMLLSLPSFILPVTIISFTSLFSSSKKHDMLVEVKLHFMWRHFTVIWMRLRCCWTRGQMPKLEMHKAGVHPLKLTALPLRIGHPKRRQIVFQPSIFRCYVTVSFREGNILDIHTLYLDPN